MTPKIAKQVMGANFLGPSQLETLPFSTARLAPPISFSEDVLKSRSDSHILVYTPSSYADGASITINSLREKFGIDPAASKPCMYNQDWYAKEEFAAKTSLDGIWHLIQKHVKEDARAKRPEEIETMLLNKEAFPTAVTCAFIFFAWWFHTNGEKLWKNDFVWCRDRDHNGDRVYVGRYEDPTGVNKSGFNVHRHLSLRPAYSAAPEITP